MRHADPAWPLGYEVGAPVRVTYGPRRSSEPWTVAGPGAWGPVLAPALLALGLGFFAVLLLFVFALLSGLLG